MHILYSENLKGDHLGAQGVDGRILELTFQGSIKDWEFPD